MKAASLPSNMMASITLNSNPSGVSKVRSALSSAPLGWSACLDSVSGLPICLPSLWVRMKSNLERYRDHHAGGGSAYEPLRNRTSSYDLCGSQTSDQILQGSASTPLVCAYWVEQPILLLLQQDSPCGKVRCVALQSEETRLRGEHKRRGGGDGVLQHIKGLLLSCTPQPVL